MKYRLTQDHTKSEELGLRENIIEDRGTCRVIMPECVSTQETYK